MNCSQARQLGIETNGRASRGAGGALEGFLDKGIWPIPTKFANTDDMNTWEEVIEEYLGRDLDNPPAEGRPPGLGWSHLRWDEFKPEVYFQTAQAGARTNGGFRDQLQRHGYSDGEFGPGREGRMAGRQWLIAATQFRKIPVP